jgi:glycosyltransferase involved in cell wall biosynthesis
MRIQHVITTLDVGGAEVHLLSQVRGQVSRGHQVRVAYLKGDGCLSLEFLDAGAETVERVSPLGLLTRLRWAEINHTHLLKADMLTALLSIPTLSWARLISSKHNDERPLLKPIFSAIHGILGRIPRRTIILSKHVVKFFERYGRLPRSRMDQIYYGLDPAPFERAVDITPEVRDVERAKLGIASDDCVLICVARFAPQKRHDLLLQGFAKAREELLAAGGPNLRLALVGGDPFGDGKARAKSAALDLGLKDSVLFLGIRRDVPALFGLSDIFVMCSEWEGLGLVFLEAMAAGLPVAATGVSAVPEVVLDGETGLLAPFGDTAALGQIFATLAMDADMRKAFGAAGHMRVHTAFNLDSMVDSTLLVYAEVHS